MSKSIHHDKILILDFGSQYTQLIARRVREAGVYCEIHPFDSNIIDDFKPRGIILSGGPETVTVEQTPRAHQAVFNAGVPVLGICYGMQTMAKQLSGQVATSTKKEFGHVQIQLDKNCRLFQELPGELNVWMSHVDKVTQVPAGFNVIASNPNTPIAAMADEDQQFYGLQFHPEVTHTQSGTHILYSFVRDICACDGLWVASQIIEDSIEQIGQQVGDEHVILGLSGGLDSSVVAALLHRAIGDQLTCVFVDTGLLRLHEADQVMRIFAKHLGIRVIHVQADIQFLSALQGVSDPEQKRKIIGRVFIEVFQKQAKTIKNAKWLAQGTIYPDVIESAGAKTGKANVIKSHHNVGGLPEQMQLKLLEPLRELFKDEVRKLGIELGLPHHIVYRHPFPGPGLGVRILNEVKNTYADILRQADAIFIDELHRADLYYKVSQAFAIFLPLKSVGVVGDGRQYEYVIALRAIKTVDFMTAHWASLPHDFLAHVANRILNEVAHVSRVVYDISSKPPATIEWE